MMEPPPILEEAGTTSVHQEYVLDPKRWFILAFFVVLSCNQCLTWFTFSSLNQDTIQGYFGSRMDKFNIGMMLNWGPIFGVLCFPFQAWFSTGPGGLRRAVWFCIFLQVSSNVLRSIPILIAEIAGNHNIAQSTAAFVFYHVGQILNAAAGPFVMASVTLLSVVWFGEAERTTATSIAYVGNGIGVTVGFLNPFWLATSSRSIPNMFYFGLFLSVIPVFSALLYFPKRPCKYPSAAAVAQDTIANASVESVAMGGEPRMCTTFSRGLVFLRNNNSFVMLILAAGILSGTMFGWQGLFQAILYPDGMAERSVAWIGFANCLAGNITSVIAGNVIDKFFKRRLKGGIVFALVALAVCLCWFTLSVPCFLFGGNQVLLPHNELSLVITLSFAGAFLGIAMPLIYELSAELIYPVTESTSAGVLVCTLNGAAGILIVLNTYLRASVINLIAVATVLAVLVIIFLFVREEYRRPSNQGGGVARSAERGQREALVLK